MTPLLEKTLYISIGLGIAVVYLCLDVKLINKIFKKLEEEIS